MRDCADQVAETACLLFGEIRDPAVGLQSTFPAHGKATLRNIAINSVMAGCKPSYLPVVLAALECTMDPRYGLHHRQTTTHGSAPLIIINGPIIKSLSMRSYSFL